MIEYLEELISARGVSGDEEEVRELIAKLAAPFADKIETDVLGNLLVWKKGRSSEKTLLVDAHMDEVGLMVREITKEGLLRFEPVGGIDARVLTGRKVRVGKARILGVIGVKAIHLCTADEKKSAPEASMLYIDIGTENKEEAAALVRVGDTAIFESETRMFGNGLLKGKALDNRVGCAALLAAMKQTPAFDTVFAFTVQEEVGLKGAYAAANRIRPDFAIVVDTTTAADIEGVAEHERACRLGQGTVLFWAEGTSVYRKESYEKVERIAKKAAVKWQYKDYIAGGLNSGAIQRSGEGVETIAIATPCRYLHSPSCVICEEDAMQTVKLVCALVCDGEIIGGEK